MHKKLAYFLTLVLILGAQIASADIYRISPGDTLQVSVWGEETLQKETKVLPDGTISFPLAGRVEVANTTTTEAEQKLTEKLKTYLPDPQVTVVVSNPEGNRAFVLGRVLKPGPIQLTGPTTVLQALSLAGGADKFADVSRIKVIRNGASGQTVIHVNYNALLKGEGVSSNIVLGRGDTVLVP